jgi:glycosyltransferase involved in cell wall biosynthesis
MAELGAGVAILLATRNGAQFLPEQLETYVSQSVSDWRLFASDDASEDSTVAILQDFQSRVRQEVSIRRGPSKGFCENFMSLARDPTIRAEYYAFSDQDDIWENDKLRRAVAQLDQIPAELPGLYFSRTELIEESGCATIGMSPLFRRPPSFSNALVQNIGGGNTMVFNNKTKLLLERTQVPVVSHDWWTYQIVSAAGGIAIYDPISSVKYRQHAQNVVGSNIGWRARLRRGGLLLGGRFAHWNKVNLGALRSMSPSITKSNLEVLERFDRSRRTKLAGRLWHLRRSGAYRQTALENLSLYVAAALNKL